MSLAGRKAFVTGAATGIGHAIAVRLAGAGAHVTLADRDAERVAATAAELAGAGSQADAVTLDMTSFVRGYVGGRLFGESVQRAQRRMRPGNSEPRGPGINRAGLALFRYRTRCCAALATRG